MARSEAATVDAYVQALPPERRGVASALRELIVAHLPAGYVEAMRWGMPGYEVPLARYPDTYNGQPLSVAAFAAQKNAWSLYLGVLPLDADKDAALRAAFSAMGRKPDIGKACVRFKALGDLPLAAIAEVIAGTSVDAFIAAHERGRSGSR